jgi:hypothetical protein
MKLRVVLAAGIVVLAGVGALALALDLPFRYAASDFTAAASHGRVLAIAENGVMQLRRSLALVCGQGEGTARLIVKARLAERGWLSRDGAPQPATIFVGDRTPAASPASPPALHTRMTLAAQDRLDTLTSEALTRADLDWFAAAVERPAGAIAVMTMERGVFFSPTAAPADVRAFVDACAARAVSLS